jgi:hypothetical protein
MALPHFRTGCPSGLWRDDEVKPLAGGAHGRCPWPSAISPARIPGCTDIWRTGKIIKAVIDRIIAGQGPVVRVVETVCKTVG